MNGRFERFIGLEQPFVGGNEPMNGHASTMNGVPAPHAAELLNLVGFITGAVLYAMLLALVLRGPVRQERVRRDWLPLATGVLGLVWNVGELLTFLLPRLRVVESSVALSAVSFPALGLLAAVVVHSVARTLLRGRWISLAGYACAAAAGLLHAATIWTGDAQWSSAAFMLLTLSFSLLIVPLAILSRRQPNGPRTVWMLALALFAISAAHLGQFHGPDSPWLVELAGHHAAIPLAFAILYQDYRFALADLFLKQALTLLVLVAAAFGGYSFVVAVAGEGALAVGVLLTLWISTTLTYPRLRRAVVRFVDSVVLGRTDYGALRAAIVKDLAASRSAEAVLDAVCARLSAALNANRVQWYAATTSPRGSEPPLSIVVPTAEPPGYLITVDELAGGRRLLSDDEALADALAALAGRRIDALRLEEIHRLTAEAELKALRAQINPHFLFNALTTVAYLIEASPKRALDTLMQLTALLRGVLRSDGDFTTLGREIDLVEHYLEIERARFEERLSVTVDVPGMLRSVRVPALIVQPLVENAIKHGITPSSGGGSVEIRAAIAGDDRLRLAVRNSGAPLRDVKGARGGHVGLNNIERRLAGHYGTAAHISLGRDSDGFTVAEIELPILEPTRDAA
jgi:two-component system, LytTR family, sensor kinase